MHRSDAPAELVARAEAPVKDEETQEPQELVDSDGAIHSTDSTPWYLQFEPPAREADSLLQRQTLPELPPDPPPLLQPMLEHIFVDLGLDDLILLDLRDLVPPPALGANLLMVIGTARSEKHLHVSADRFCRWMKTTHQIAPYADGLLGRGELKLKLRRKARRARILSRVGSTETSKTDDGIRTGWICVTVDDIEDGRRPTGEIQRASDGYVGFGGEEGGVKVVIQMLTQEKREELDLEDLWGKTMRRHQRKQDRISRGLEDADPPDEVGQSPLYDEGRISDISSITSSSSFLPPRHIHNQTRPMHSSALRVVRRLSTGHRYHNGAAALSNPEMTTASPDETVERRVQKTITDKFLTALPLNYERQIRDNGKQSAESFRLKSHIDFAKSLSYGDARSILGEGAQDAYSNPFLRSFHEALPLFPTAEHWEIRLSLVHLGIDLLAPGYNKRQLALLFREMQSSLTSIPASLYKQTVIRLLTPNRPDNDGGHPHLTTASLYDAASILEDMHFRGHDIALTFTPDSNLRSLLELSILQAQPSPTSPPLHPEAPRRLRRLLNRIYPSPPPLDLELQKLQVCANVHNFQGMWDIWHSFAADMRPRPAELYIAMLQGFAESGHQARNMEVLRVLVPEMEREEPPVVMDAEVAEAVRKCVLVVDPGVEEEGLRLYESEGVGDIEAMGELLRLWSRCERVVQEEGRWARELDDE